MSIERPRFYRDVSVLSGVRRYGVFLDGRPLKTPAGAVVELPTEALAEAIAQEWRDQEAKVRTETMLLTKLANTAIDRVGANRPLVIAQIVAFGRTDLVCYRADAPVELIRRQASAWDPLLEWLRRRHGVDLRTVSGLTYVKQKHDGLRALEAAVAGRDDFMLTALHGAATLCGSLTIALGLIDGRLDAGEAIAAAELDENYQAERWGKDPEIAAKSAAKRRELIEISRFIELLAK
jgi:chaperone required for assembly of F1-ATPase